MNWFEVSLSKEAEPFSNPPSKYHLCLYIKQQLGHTV